MKKNKKKFKLTHKTNIQLVNNTPIEVNVSKEKRTYKHTENYYTNKMEKDYEKYKNEGGTLPQIIYNSMWKNKKEKGEKVSEIGKNITFQDKYGMSKSAYDARRRIIEKQIKEGSYESKKDPHSKAQAALNMSNEALKKFTADYYDILKTQGLDKKAISDAIHNMLYMGE